MTTSVASSPQMRIGYLISTFVDKAAFAALTCIFAIAGAIVGVAAGAVLGPAKGVGCCKGARMGAFSGTIMAVEMLQATSGRGRWSLMEIFLSLVNGKAFQEWVGEALMPEDEVEVSFEDHLSLFDFGSTKGMQSESVRRLPKFLIQEKIKASADEMSCAICLQYMDPALFVDNMLDKSCNSPALHDGVNFYSL
ncbi:hypothetical protein EJ110_NYTH21364 [Nymphaea thermarum]|nr:hypothetical protein EJ110_NYTH21364 [Nymphaea thermarum]